VNADAVLLSDCLNKVNFAQASVILIQFNWDSKIVLLVVVMAVQG
jgi:hypothetical protein